LPGNQWAKHRALKRAAWISLICVDWRSSVVLSYCRGGLRAPLYRLRLFDWTARPREPRCGEIFAFHLPLDGECGALDA
jgi:hypothetical protein